MSAESYRSELLEVLESIDGGEFLAELDAKIAKARAHAVENGAPAKLTITLDFKREGATFPARVDIQPGATMTYKEPKRGKGVFYQRKDGRLSMRHPDQAELFKDDSKKADTQQGQPATDANGKPLKN